MVVAHRDRLYRLGFELVENLIIKTGGKNTVLASKDKETGESKKLAYDILAIIATFSYRQMGRRSYSNKKRQSQDDKNKDLPNNIPEIMSE